MIALSVGGGALVLAGAAVAGWAFSRRARGKIDSAEAAADAAETALVGFVTHSAVVGADGQVALVVDTTGRVAVVRFSRARLITSEVPWSLVRSTTTGIVVETGDGHQGEVALTGVDVLDIRRMSPGASRH